MGFVNSFHIVIYTAGTIVLCLSLFFLLDLRIPLWLFKLPIVKQLKSLYLHFFEKATQPLHFFTLSNQGVPKRLCTIYPRKNETVRKLKLRGIKTTMEILERQNQESDLPFSDGGDV